jgi:predicted PurR-regulated permease PerM
VVVGLYTAIQVVESYGVTALIQQRTVSLPPGLTIAMQVLIGVLTGVAGVALATPMTAAGLVLVRELYIKDRLERDGRDRSGSAAAHCPGSPGQAA